MQLSRTAITAGIVLTVMLFVGLWVGGNYNSLVSARNQVDKNWSNVETNYQRRFDLIGNLAESVKGSQAQESKVFKDIADARRNYTASGATPDQKAEAASQLETNVAIVPRLQEAYPDLKSNERMQQLMTELTKTEDGVLSARQKYNDTVNNYNTGIQRFPKNIFAGVFNFDPKPLFKADEGAAKAPQIKFTQ